jgi:predicted N-acyltransferase
LHQLELTRDFAAPGHPARKLTLGFVASIARVNAASWNACVPNDNPFLCHQYLLALEESGNVGGSLPSLPCHAVLQDSTGGLIAAAPGMTISREGLGLYKAESMLAGIFAKRQLPYYPTYELDIPSTPLRAPKLLVAPNWPKDQVRQLLLGGIMKALEVQKEFSSFHVARFAEDELPCIRSAGLHVSPEPSSVWHNRGYSSFEEWLGTLHAKRRYYIRQERKSANTSGLDFRALRGNEVTAAHWADFHRGHVAVCAKHGNKMLLAPQLYPRVAASMGRQLVLIAAFDGGNFVAGVPCLYDADTLYLGPWSMLVERSNLALELAMHRPIEWAIATGLKRVDSSITAPYKTYRGYQTETLHSAHWVRDPVLASEAAELFANYHQAFNQHFHGKPLRLFRNQTSTSELDLP